ncbi:MAG TPA: glutamate 5-kinase [Treponemataceae bacterium]|nr:glutamate 5-kinase [Treponemataceae bacterium]
MTIAQTIKDARKIVLKIGSNTLAKADGKINLEFMQSFAEQCTELTKEGKQIVLVSSGAQVAGISTINRWARKTDLNYRQALCAIGQVELMDCWRNCFAKHNLHIAQLLLTKDDFGDQHRTLNIRNTLFTLIDEGVIPIVNENDSVAFDEISIGDNDNLSALTAILWSADLLILFSDIDGIYSKNPKEHPDATLIELITNIKKIKNSISIGKANCFGTGGIVTKFEAAEKIAQYGVRMILANGSKPSILRRLADGSEKATLFLPEVLR